MITAPNNRENHFPVSSRLAYNIMDNKRLYLNAPIAPFAIYPFRRKCPKYVYEPLQNRAFSAIINGMSNFI